MLGSAAEEMVGGQWFPGFLISRRGAPVRELEEVPVGVRGHHVLRLTDGEGGRSGGRGVALIRENGKCAPRERDCPGCTTAVHWRRSAGLCGVSGPRTCPPDQPPIAT